MKNLLLVAGLLVLVSGLAFAQNTGVATAIFTVETGIVVTGEEDADWGVLAAGTVYTISADGLITPPTPEGEVNVGGVMFWTIEAPATSNITVNIVLPQYFVGENTGARVPYSVNAQSAGWFAEDPDIGIAHIPFDPRVPFTGTINVDAAGFVGLGGIVSLPSSLPPFADEVYRGAFILTATFAGL
jgi:hypothetical protein